ncbi:MAG: S8 family peptidase [Bacteroidales bacterium]|nr:S8 family peptidase [Bacteroidales bacterium]
MKHIFLFLSLSFLFFLGIKVTYSQTTFINTILPNSDSVEFDRFLYALEIPGALEYEFYVQEISEGISESIIKDVNYFTLNELTADKVFGGSYIIKVRAYLSGDTLNYGMPVVLNTIEEQNYAYGQIMVKIKPAYVARINEYYPNLGDTLVLEIPGFDDISNDVNINRIDLVFKPLIYKYPELQYNYKIVFDESYSNDSLIAFIQNTEMFEYAHKSYIKKPDTNDPLYINPGSTCFECPTSTYYQWYLDSINASAALNEPNSGNFKISVAIIDDAVNVDHEDLRGNIWINQGELTPDILTNADTSSDGWIDANELLLYLGYTSLEDLIITAPISLFDIDDNDGNGYIDDICGWDITDNTFLNGGNNPLPFDDNFDTWAHGTHVAGIAGAVTNNSTGMSALTSNNIYIIPIKAQDNVSGSFSANNVIDGINYAASVGAKIINMSFGSGSYEPTEQLLINTLAAQGIIFIASVGNDEGSYDHYPAKYDNVIAVGNVNPYNTIAGNNPDYLDVFAPGVNIASTIVGGTEQYGCKTGTSMSTPLVSSLYAFLLSHNENLSTQELNSCVFNNCEIPVPISSNGAFGKIRAYESLMCILGQLNAEYLYPEEDVSFCLGTAEIFVSDYSSGISPETFLWSCVSCATNDYVIDSPTSEETDITFYSEGDYEIQLVVSNDTMTDSISHIIHVRDAYIERLSDSLTTICGDDFEYITFEVHVATPPYEIQYTINSTDYTLNTSSNIVHIPVSGDGVLTINSLSDTLNCSVSNLNVNAYFESVDCGCYTKYNNNWHFGDNLHLGFNSDPILDDQSFMSVSEGCSSISDSWGNTLFYTDGLTIFEPNGTQHQLFTPIGSIWTPSQTLILPVPNTSNKYAVFSPGNSVSIASSVLEPMKFAMITYDQILNEIEEIEVFNMPVPADVFLIEKVTWVPKVNSDNIWVICRSEGNNNLYVFELSESGLSAHVNNPFVFPGNYYSKRGTMKASPTNDVVAEVFFDISEGPANEGAIRFYSFNNTTGVFNNFSENDTEDGHIIKSPWGCEFSPSGSRFYYTRYADNWIFSCQTLSSGNIGTEDLKPFSVAWSSDITTQEGNTILPTNLQRKGNAIYVAMYETQAILGVMTNTDTDNPYTMPACLSFDGINTGETVWLGIPPIVPERESYIEIAQQSTGCDSCDNSIFVNYFGVDNFSVLWSNSSTADTLYDVCIGETYAVTVTNLDLNCSDSATFVVESHFMALDSLQIYSNCDSSTNELHVWFRGGNAPYTILVNSTTDTIINNHFIYLNPTTGNNNITITDANNCVLDTVVFASVAPFSVDINLIGTNYCSGEDNVTANAIVTNGFPDYSYQWGSMDGPISFFGTESYLENLISYPEHLYVTATDSYGCTAFDSILIPSTILAADLDIDVIYPCQSTPGSIDLTITGGGTITDIYWLIPNGVGGVDTINNQQDLDTVFNQGFYRVFVSDDNGCTYNGITVINLYDEPLVHQPSCSWEDGIGSIITNWDIAEEHGDYNSYNWLINSSMDSIPEVNGIFDSLPGDTYILYHTDESGCNMYDTISIVILEPLDYSVSVDYFSDTLGNPMFTSSISVWGESLPYDVLDIYATQGPVISCNESIEFEIINDTVLPAEYEVTGYLSDCMINYIDSLPYFVLFGASTNNIYDCDLIDIFIFDSIPNFHDTIYFDTIVKPTKCLASGYGDGVLQICNISTAEDIYPVFFYNSTTGDTLVWNGSTSDTLVFENLEAGITNISFWNAFSGVNTVSVIVSNLWDFELSGTVTTGTYPAYDGQIIAIESIVVESLASLTFKNCTIYTAYDTYNNISETEWIVKYRGKLTIENSTIQSGCPQKWMGITAKAISPTHPYSQTLTQSPQMGEYYNYHGYVVMTGSSLIRDAKKAICLEIGSVVNSQNSTFTNNEYAIYFTPYSRNSQLLNVSTIKTNTFIIDSLLHPTTLSGTDRYPISQLYIDQVLGGINLLGNSFNFIPTTIHSSGRGNAIYNYASKLIVKEYGSYSSIIGGFEYGIKCESGSASARTVSIGETNFTGNVTSVFIKNFLAPRVTNNEFNCNFIFQHTPPPFFVHPLTTAIYLEACDQYDISLNDIKNAFTGAYIRNSGENYNLLYKNDFDSVAYPAMANLKNSNFEQFNNIGETGLEIKCNDFDHFYNAISVTGNMQQSQGVENGQSQQLAGNRFYTPTSTTNTQSEFCVSTSIPVDLNVARYDYYHHNNALCLPDKHTPLKVETHNFILIPYDENSACPDSRSAKSTTKSTSSIFEQYVEIDDSISLAISNKETELQQIVDNGNTLLLQAIASGMNNSNYNQVMTDLNLEGMISDDVVLELMQNTQAPSAAKTLTLIENSPLPKVGKDKVNEMTDVDENLRAILLHYQDGKNAREIKESEINNMKQEKRRNISQLIKYVAYEDDDLLNSNLIDFLESQHTIIDNKTAFRFALANNDYHKADQFLTNLQTMSQTMDINKKTEIENYIQLQSIAINAEDNVTLADSIVYANAEFLFALANDTLVVESAQAQVILEHAGLAEYPPIVYPPVIDNQKSVKIKSPINPIKDPANEFFKIYPNPVKEILYVEYFLLDIESEENKYLEVLSETGELIERIQISNQAGIIQLNVRNYKPAIYLIRLNTTSYKFTKN